MDSAPLRRQLTLFVPAAQSAALEALRARLDPVQHGLIAAHVTLCRETELGQWHAIAARLARLRGQSLVLTFGPPQPFYEHGILMPCTDGAAQFHALRAALLGGAALPQPAPHLTLAHPRNPRAPGNLPGAAATFATPLRLAFDRITLIEQRGKQPWQRLAAFPLAP